MNNSRFGQAGRHINALLLSHWGQPTPALATQLSELGISVRLAPIDPGAASIVRSQNPDLVLIEDGNEGTSLGPFLSLLRSEGVPDRTTPLVVVSPRSVVPANELVALLEQGVWEVLTHPVNAQAFVARLNNLLAARDHVAELQSLSFVDTTTKLYSRRGLEVRAGEMAAQCARQGTLLACVAFSLSASDSVSRSLRLQNGDLTAIGTELLRVGRSSDAIGRADDNEFVVLAPGASGSDARQLAHRITRSVIAMLGRQGIEADAPWVGRVLQPSREASRLGEELLTDTLLALQEVTAEHEIPASLA